MKQTAGHNHAVIWIDHRQARIFYVGRTGSDQIVLKSEHSGQHIHHKANSIGSGHAAEDRNYLKSAAAALAGLGTILVLGPSVEKFVFHNFLRDYNRATFNAIVAVESSDHQSDNQIIALARRHFNLAEVRSA